jgi:thiamine transport system permease protein
VADLKHQLGSAFKHAIGSDNSGQSFVLIRHFRLTRISGILFGLFFLFLGCLILFQMFVIAGSSDSLDVIFTASILKIIKSACWQAFLSTALSLVIGMVCARALHRRNSYWLSEFVLSASFLALVVPSSIAALGVVAVWGRNGLFGSIGFSSGNLYGLWMVVLAHVFFNAPLVLRVAYSALVSQPGYFWKIAAQNNLTSWQTFKIIEWPSFQPLIIALSSLIFLLCFTSFSIVLMLGGGPNVTTLEVSIYHAVRFSFDLPLAAALSVLQIIICSILIFSSKPINFNISSPKPTSQSGLKRNDREKLTAKILDTIFLTGFIILIFLPVIALLFRLDLSSGLKLFSQNRFWNAFYISSKLALLSSITSVAIAVILINSRYRLAQVGNQVLSRFIDFSVSFYLLMPAIVFATGCFILFRQFVNLFDMVFWMVLIANILFSLPFITRILTPSFERILSQHDKISLQLGITGLRRFMALTLPSLHREFQLVLGISFAFSLGDLSVITLFGNHNFETLPYYLYQLFGRYGASEADMLGIFILGYIFTAYMIFGFAFWCVKKINVSNRMDIGC